VDHPDLPGSTNLVAIEYSIGRGDRRVKIFKNREGAHSEPEMDEFVQEHRKLTVHEIYSERQPCGPSESDCEGLLLKRYPHAKTTFGYNYQEAVPAGERERSAPVARSRLPRNASGGRSNWNGTSRGRLLHLTTSAWNRENSAAFDGGS
jgi:hypothetical protein